MDRRNILMACVYLIVLSLSTAATTAILWPPKCVLSDQAIADMQLAEGASIVVVTVEDGEVLSIDVACRGALGSTPEEERTRAVNKLLGRP